MANIARTLVHMIVLCVSFSLVLIIAKIVYNIFFHPLRSYPGPLLARATVVVKHRALLSGKVHLWQQELHAKYGPVVRYAPDELSFIDGAAWKDAYGHGTVHNFPKDPRFYGLDAAAGHEAGLIGSDNDSHARQRKIVAHAFSDKALRDQELLLKGYTELLLKQLRKAIGRSGEEKVDLTKWYNFTTFDIMGDLTFGEPLHLLDSSTYTPWVESIFGNTHMAVVSLVLRAWGLEPYVKMILPASIRAMRQKHIQHSVDRVEKRLAKDTDRPDIWTYVLRNSGKEHNEGQVLTKGEMHNNAGLFMLAGTETTATELSGLTYYLLMNPIKLDRLTREIRGAFRSYQDMTINNLMSLKYLDACIHEGLRMYPPVAFGLPRAAPPGGGKVAGHWVPAGTSVQFAQYAAYHSPDNFKDPNDFVPERWLPEGQADYGSDKKDAMQPFSFGPRNCLGKNLAYHEMRLVLASVLWAYDIELCDESKNWVANQDCLVLWHKGPLMCNLMPMKDLSRRESWKLE